MRKSFAIVAGVLACGVGVAVPAVADDAEHDVENFQFSRWDLSYDVSLDTQGRAIAEVTEQLHAEFPEVDQNRGIIRSLPVRYHSAPAAPENISVTDEAGHEVPFEVEDEEGFRSILVGDDDFVHGPETYVIRYTLDDVMHATDQADEFYWDVIPSDRGQVIENATAQIRLDPELASALTGSAACYVGTPEDSQSCDLEFSEDEAVFRVAEGPLPGGHGLTVAIGVDPGTVTQPPERHDNFLLDVVPLLLVIAATLVAGFGALAVWAMVRRHRSDTSQASIGYGIPEQMNPLLAGPIAGKSHDPIVASILDLAVRGVVRIEETSQTSRWLKQTETKPVLRLLAPELVEDPQERVLLRGMFPELVPGETFDFPKDSKPFRHATESVIKASGEAVLERGYLVKKRHRGAALAGWSALALLIPATVLLIMGISRDNNAMGGISVLLGMVCLVLIAVCVTTHRVLTPRGAAVRQQLERMQQLMRTSDAERLEMLQSFSNAPRQQDDEGSYLQMYDRLLPYAVQFGREKEWTKVMATTYTQYNWSAPIWYPLLFSGRHGSAESALGAMLSSVSSAASTASPTAGSTGGGAVGGGGGGGAAGGR
ncbi:putative membrane protein DUF2207 [Enteractinococcus coprophilus]|uniref:Putative membrane protein DUF2207 n=2 Tax=Enteractinococcus coprophilus TaxID=1027633 RepID=A0A543AIF9_9MICC|nr:putative membrane protein DUF2207 [Enteractinococcus coprophilus]